MMEGVLGWIKIIVWYSFHTAQKVGLVGQENILSLTKIFKSPVVTIPGKYVRKNSEAWQHTHATLYNYSIGNLHMCLAYIIFYTKVWSSQFMQKYIKKCVICQ